jgi:hypothetical protein
MNNSSRHSHIRHPGEGRDPAFAVALLLADRVEMQTLGPGLRRGDDFVGNRENVQ